MFIILFLLAIPAFLSAGTIDFDFESGTVPDGENWRSTGNVTNASGTGYQLSTHGEPFNRSGQSGLRIGSYQPTSGANAYQIPFEPLTDLVVMTCSIKPYILGGTTNGVHLAIGSESGLDSQNGFSNVGVSFMADGTVRTRDMHLTTIGTFTSGAWVDIVLIADIPSNTFSVELSGPGMTSPLDVADLTFSESANVLSYWHVLDDGPGPVEHALDNLSVDSLATTATQVLSWSRLKELFKD